MDRGRRYWFGCVVASAALWGCGDDGGSGGAGGSGGGATAPTTTGSTTASSSIASTSTGGVEPDFYLAKVRGELFTNDLAEARGAHDAVAQGGKRQATAAGNFAHDVHLGTDVFGTTPDEFLAIDRWTNASGMTAFYSDPAVQQAFGSLFAAPPELETFGHRPDWYGWGDLDASDGLDPHFWAVVRGRLKTDDLAGMRALHDGIAAGGEEAAAALGDVGHVVFLGLEDSREFLAIDVWDNPDGPVTLYSDPGFQQAFADLFEAPPTIGIYASTDWYQW